MEMRRGGNPKGKNGRGKRISFRAGGLSWRKHVEKKKRTGPSGQSGIVEGNKLLSPVQSSMMREEEPDRQTPCLVTVARGNTSSCSEGGAPQRGEKVNPTLLIGFHKALLFIKGRLAGGTNGDGVAWGGGNLGRGRGYMKEVGECNVTKEWTKRRFDH